ncbi:MAG: flagellar biosynthetic protein FliO [Tepidisphaeraceae bacterium]
MITGARLYLPAWTAVLLLWCCGLPALAQSTRPTTNAAIESTPVVRSRPATASADDGGVNWQRVVFATAVVLVLIVTLRYAAGWLMPSTRGGGGRGVRVLSRTPIAPRQQVMLLHIGRRVVVVGDSAGKLAALAEITEPDEVAELLGQVSSTPPVSASAFRSLLGRSKEPFDDTLETVTAADDPDAQQPADPALAAAQDDIAGLRERMKNLAKTVGR